MMSDACKDAAKFDPYATGKWHLTHLDDPNESYDLESETLVDAAWEALELLGWGITQTLGEEGENEA